MDYPLTVRTKALTLYLDGLNLPAIASKILVPPGTLKGWAREEQWSDKRRLLKAEITEQADFDLQKFQSEKRLAIVSKQLAILESIHERIEAALATGKKGNWTSSAWLKELAGSFKSAHDISKSLIGLKDASAPGQVNANVQVNSLIQYGSAVKPVPISDAKTVQGESRVIPPEIAAPADPF